MAEYNIDVQKLYLEMFLADAESFARAQNIFNPNSFDRKLQPLAKFIKDNMEDFYKATLSAIPAGRMGAAQDVANAVVFLGSPAAGYITGTNVVVDGGFTKGVHF